jgi:hypothetical protein
MKSKFPSTSSMLQIEAPTKCDEKSKNPMKSSCLNKHVCYNIQAPKCEKKNKNPMKSSFPQPTSKADMLQIQADMLQSKLQQNMRKKSKTQ